MEVKDPNITVYPFYGNGKQTPYHFDYNDRYSRVA